MPSPQELYQQRGATFDAAAANLDRRARRQGNVSLALFFGALALLAVAVWNGNDALTALAFLGLVAFVASLVYRNRLASQQRRMATLAALNQEGLHRLARRWDGLPLPPATAAPQDGAAQIDAATAADLDILGRAGLEQLLGTPTTPIGWATLRRWLLTPADGATMSARQTAAAELAPRVELREEVAVRGRLMESSQAEYEQFIAWAEQPGWLARRPALLWAARLLTLATLLFFVTTLLGLPTTPALVAVLVVNLAFSFTFGGQVDEQITQVAARQGVFAAYGGMFGVLAGQQFTAPALQQIHTALSAEGLSADRQMHKLERLMPLADIRRSILFILVQAATLWSFHLLWLLERWQRHAGGSVRGWLAALGEAEALLALATLHHDHPAWVFPVLEAGASPRFTASGLAHPLLPPDRAVGNDVTLGPPGSFLLVTGSNMAGKSTLLRAVGVNTVLAQMGAPVSAAHLTLTPLTLAASMRVQDSLEQGVSFFMAELQRLKAIVDLAGACQQPPARPLLYLLDEILQGTNTHERQIAARRIILQLVAAGSIGAVSTHDLNLADAPEVAAAAVLVHFTESFTRGAAGPTMTFDYKLRPGIATTTNALKLMELVGLLSDEGDGVMR
jgi:ABC-type multidrug transport system fused ATPase/permease subunit